MQVFVTGATGFIGSAIVDELISAGHKAVGLARSDAGAQSLTAAGAQVHRGDLRDLESLRSAAARSDGVIHCAFIHDFSRFAENCAIDRHAIEAMGRALAGSNRPLLVSSGTALLAPGRLVDESTDPPKDEALPRVSEQTALATVSAGVRAAAMRLPPTVHGAGDHGFIPMLINLAREKRASAYIGDGQNHWPAVHRLDAAHLYRLALEQGSAGARYHAVAEEGVPFRQIAEVIGRRLNVPVISIEPEQAPAHFGWMARFAGIDNRASSRRTRDELQWQPQQPGVIADLDQPHYFQT